MSRVTAKQVVEDSAPVRRPKNRKAQIALAAAELFCEHGYHGIGIDEIAQAVGITGPALYRHFPNKYAMLVHATRDLSDAALESTGSDDLPREPEPRLDRMLIELSRLAVLRRQVGGLYQWEGRFLEPTDRARLRTDLRTLVDRITGPLSALRPDLSATQAQIIGRGVLSIMGSLSTHRAAIGPTRAEELLHGTGWSLLRADLTLAVAAPMTANASTVADPSPLSRREKIVAEALRLFHAHGYHGVSMEEIAAAAGTKASSLYRHFPGKAELLAAVYHRAADRIAASTSAALTSASDRHDALARLIDAFVALVFGHSDLVTVYQAENTNLPQPDRHELRKAQRLHVEEWTRILDPLRPDLTTPQTRVLVHAALNLISDLGRYLRFDPSHVLYHVVAGLARTALHGDAMRRRGEATRCPTRFGSELTPKSA
jgi:AcrR family transcriptional regulator